MTGTYVKQARTTDVSPPPFVPTENLPIQVTETTTNDDIEAGNYQDPPLKKVIPHLLFINSTN